MEIQHSDIGDVRKVILAGRLDTAGVDLIETRFGASIVPAGKNTVVDLSQVTFLASMGIRMLIATNRSLSRKGGKFALYGATPAVTRSDRYRGAHRASSRWPKAKSKPSASSGG